MGVNMLYPMIRTSTTRISVTPSITDTPIYTVRYVGHPISWCSHQFTIYILRQVLQAHGRPYLFTIVLYIL